MPRYTGGLNATRSVVNPPRPTHASRNAVRGVITDPGIGTRTLGTLATLGPSIGAVYPCPRTESPVACSHPSVLLYRLREELSKHASCTTAGPNVAINEAEHRVLDNCC